MNIINRYFKTKSFENLVWLLSDKVLRLCFTFFIGILITRHLGPIQFGQWNYVLAFVGLIASLANMGIDSILLNEIIENKNNESEKVFKVAISFRLISGFVGYLIIILLFLILSKSDENLLILALVLGTNIIWQISDFFDILFQANHQIKRSTIPKYITFVVMAFLKIIGIYYKLSLFYFVFITSIELALNFIILFFIANKLFHKFHFCFDFKIFKTLFSKGLPLLLSSFLIIFYMKTDQIMLGIIKGDFDVGIYTSALKLSEIWYFIPTVIVSAFSAEFLSQKQLNLGSFDTKIIKITSFLIYTSVFFGVMVAIFSKEIIDLVYGAQFQLSSQVLTIHIWTGVFVSMGVSSNLYLISNNLNYVVFYKSLIGAALNILLNLLLIPMFASSGSAYATLISYFIVAFISDLFWQSTHPMFKLKIESIGLPFIILINRINDRHKV